MAGNLFRIIKWLGVYVTWPALCAIAFASSIKKYKGIAPKLVIASVLFLAPFIVVGKVVASRYIFPIVGLLIPVIAISLWEGWQKSKSITLALVIIAIVQSSYFIYTALSDPTTIPLPHEDHVQYLSEWSAGFGIPEIRDIVKNLARSQRVIVATEGYFGTLPDGLLMYFIDAPEIENVEIFGIGQPIDTLPEELIEKAKSAKTFLVVNEHRLKLPIQGGQLSLIKSYPKPDGPALLLLEVMP